MATIDPFLSVFCRRRNVFATEPPKNDWLRWLTDLPTIRRELLLRWVCRLWWTSGARILSTLYVTGLVRFTTPPPGSLWFRDVEDYRWMRNPCSALWVCLVYRWKSRTRSITISSKSCSPVFFLGWNPCRTRLYWQIRCRPRQPMEMFLRWSYSCTSSQLFSRRPPHFAQAKMLPHPSEWSMFTILFSFGLLAPMSCVKLVSASVFRCFFPFDFWCSNLFLSWNFVWCRRIWEMWRTWIGVSLLPTSCTMHSQARCTKRVVDCI